MFRHLFLPRIHFEKPADGGGSPAPAAAANPLPDDILKGLQNLIQRQGGESEALKLLYNDNHALRESNRQLKDKVPGDDAIVLKGDDAKAWREVMALGKPEEIKSKIGEHATLSTEIAGYKRKDNLGAVAAATGYNADVLAKLAGTLEIEVVEETRDGKTVKAAFVKEGDKKTSLDQYAQANWGPFMPVLKSGQSQASGSASPGGQSVAFASPGGGGGGDDVVAARIKAAQEQRSKQGNPFNPQRPT